MPDLPDLLLTIPVVEHIRMLLVVVIEAGEQREEEGEDAVAGLTDWI